MSKIKIKNFGPIKAGCIANDGWIDVKKVTLFIGNQGSGKSTVAKLISTFTWIEKALIKGVLRLNDLDTKSKFEKRLEYLKLKNYLLDDTLIQYKGNAYAINYLQGTFSIIKNEENGYLLPKIMYVPAERTFLSVVDRPDRFKDLPATLYTFNDEYDGAKSKFYAGIQLPINNTSFVYDKSNKLAHIQNSNGLKLRLSEASSGFQSTVPLILVTKYLAEGSYLEEDISTKETSLEEQRKLEKEIKQILEDPTLTHEVRQASLRQISARRKPVCFINIVEEPEQNLFPSSQQKMLYSLLEYNNVSAGNKLIMTSHSPYLINYLTLAVKAYSVKKKLTSTESIEKLNEIVPIQSTVNPDDLIIYELNEEDGSILKLESYKGLPSDENYLNDSLGDTNELFAQLQQIEKGWL